MTIVFKNDQIKKGKLERNFEKINQVNEINWAKVDETEDKLKILTRQNWTNLIEQNVNKLANKIRKLKNNEKLTKIDKTYRRKLEMTGVMLLLTENKTKTKVDTRWFRDLISNVPWEISIATGRENRFSLQYSFTYLKYLTVSLAPYKSTSAFDRKYGNQN